MQEPALETFVLLLSYQFQDFLIQTQRYDFDELTRSSILPFFATDATLRFSDIPDERVPVAIKDEEAAVTYYAVCLSSKISYFRDLFKNANRDTK